MTKHDTSVNVSLLPTSDSEVYLAVLGRIQRGEISGGDRVLDTALATEFNLSRMPVRQALLRLVHEGYLVGTTRGFVLPRFSGQDIKDIFEVRMLLEPRAAASACQVIADADISGFRAAYDDAREATQQGDALAMMQANDHFRRIWLESVPNRRLAASIGRYVDHVQIVRRMTVIDTVTQQVILDLLGKLVDAFERRDALAVHDHSVQFVARARDSFFAQRGEGGEQAFICSDVA